MKSKDAEFSIWLMPSGQLYDRLAGLIRQLSEQCRTPVFDPHVTLIGSLRGNQDELVAKTARLSQLIRPNTIRLTTVDYHTEYFRCLFVHAEKTDWLINANIQAREIFDRTQSPEYMPHLSLMYGEFPPAKKQEIIAGIGAEFALHFQVSDLYLYSTNGEPKDWFRAQQFLLRGM